MAGIEEIKKLDPEERIKALKKVEDERKQEIEEAESLIRDSMREIKDASDKRHAPIKEVTAHDISQLLTVEEKRMFKTARFEDSSEEKTEEAEQKGMPNLEEVAEEEAKNKKELTHAPIYGKAIEKARESVDYSAKTTATGERVEQREGVQEIYSSKSVTGESGKPQEMYGNKESGSISGTYERKKDDRKRSEWE